MTTRAPDGYWSPDNPEAVARVQRLVRVYPTTTAAAVALGLSRHHLARIFRQHGVRCAGDRNRGR